MKWRAFGATVVVAGLVLCLTGCVAQGPMDYSDGPAGNDTPVEDRQYLDDYYAAVVPAMLEYLHVTNETLGTDWKRGNSDDMFMVSECRDSADDERRQYRMLAGLLIGNPVPIEKIIAAGDEMFLALGFTRDLAQEKDGVFHVQWTDWQNGGYMTLELSADHVYFRSTSECRYAHNVDAIEYMVTILPMPPEESPSPTASRSARLVSRREAAASGRPRRS